jgi:tripartite-type tricarboxylate transporter receptor subunit TctC
MLKQVQAGCAAIALAFAGAAFAQGAFPTKPVKFIVTFPPGGPSDIMARLLADKLQASLKQPFVVENRPGAGGNVGTQAVASGPADGYTVLFGIDTTFTVNPTIYPSLPFRLDDLKPLMLIGSSGLAVGVHPSLGVSSMAELIASGKAKPLLFSSGGNGSPGHLAAAILAEKTGAKVEHIPYKGNTPAVMAVVSGEVQAGILATPGFLPHVQSGRVKALAVTSRQRSPLAPNVPTVAEAGVPAVDVEVLYLATVRAATPDAIVTVLQNAMKEALAQPDIKERLTKLDIAVLGETSPAVAERLAIIRARYAPTIKAVGMKID